MISLHVGDKGGNGVKNGTKSRDPITERLSATDGNRHGQEVFVWGVEMMNCVVEKPG